MSSRLAHVEAEDDSSAIEPVVSIDERPEEAAKNITASEPGGMTISFCGTDSTKDITDTLASEGTDDVTSGCSMSDTAAEAAAPFLASFRGNHCQNLQEEALEVGCKTLEEVQESKSMLKVTDSKIDGVHEKLDGVTEQLVQLHTSLGDVAGVKENKILREKLAKETALRKAAEAKIQRQDELKLGRIRQRAKARKPTDITNASGYRKSSQDFEEDHYKRHSNKAKEDARRYKQQRITRLTTK